MRIDQERETAGGKTNRTLCLLAAFLLMLIAGQAYAFEVTRVRHLFDIKHGFLQPSDVAVGKDRRIYVLDGVNSSVKVFDAKGTFILSFGSKGAGEGEFGSPIGISTDSRGRIYIADSGNSRIQIFDPSGNFINQFPVGFEKTAADASDPVDIVPDEGRNRLYVADNDNHQILVYDLKNFKLIDAWGTKGEGIQMFNHPFMLALGKDTSILVVDVLNTRVQMWSPNGKAISSIGEWGVELGQLYRPKGVCVDEQNNIYIGDSYLGVLQVFNRYGHFQSVVGNEDGKIIKWKTPVGISIDSDQRLYVVEMITNRVKVYKIIGTGKI